MAKNRTRTDWQIDLKPAPLTTSPVDRAPSSNGNGSYPTPDTRPAPIPPPTPAVADPSLSRALGELRAADESLIAGLVEIRTALLSIRTSIDELSGRVATIEARLVAPAAPTRPVRETSRTLRDSPTGALERRPRRAKAPAPGENAAD